MFSLYRGKSSDHLYLPAVAFGGLRSADFAEYENHGEWGVVPHCRQGDAKGRFKTLEQGELFLAAKPTETEQWYLKTRYGYCRLDGENEVADAASLFRYPLNKPARLYNRPDDTFEGSCNRKFMAGIVFRSQTRELAFTDGEGGYCLFPDPNKDIGLYSGVLESAQFGVRSQIFPSVSRLPARDRGLCLGGPSLDNQVFKKSGNNATVTCDTFCKGPQWGRVGSCLRTEFEGVTSLEIKGNEFQPGCFETLPSFKLPLPAGSQLACYCTAKM
jgi:hypothetical protein